MLLKIIVKLDENSGYTQSKLEADMALLLMEVKISLRYVLKKKREVIIRLGTELLKRIGSPDEICGSIKYMLRKEISDGTISVRSIELFCPREWKKQTRPPKNEKISISSDDKQGIAAIPATKPLTTNFLEHSWQKSHDLGTFQNPYAMQAPKQSSGFSFELQQNRKIWIWPCR
jgi:hypothetical protein